MAQTHEKCATLQTLEQKRYLYQAVEDLDAAKKDFEKKREHFMQEKARLEKRRAALQESKDSFSGLVKDSEEKRKEGELRFVEEKHLCEHIDADIIGIKERLEVKMVEQGEIAEAVNQNSRYHLYLSSFMKHVRHTRPDQFTEISDVLNKHAALTKTDLLGKQQHKLMSDDDDRKESHVALNYNNQVCFLEKELESCSLIKDESQAATNKLAANSRTIEVGQIFGAIENLLERYEGQPHTSSGKLKKRREKESNSMLQNANGVAELGVRKTSFEARTLAALRALNTIEGALEDYSSISE
mmetsp:Transcript_8959/g.18290  ORF Transcript_8959/g.18290 Transcript_8959/m.18290 type:complete len:299 (-) Transcript_8959:1047-1943(-)